MRRRLFLIGYWLVHTAGVLPVKLKSPKEKKKEKKDQKAPVSLNGQRTTWTPWSTSRRAFLIGIVQILIILYNTTRLLGRYTDDGDNIIDWDSRFFRQEVMRMLSVAKAIASICAILIITTRCREIEELLNDVCFFHFAFFKSTDPPKTRKFAYLIVYAISSCTLATVLAILPGASNINFFQNFFWQASYMFTLLYVEVTSGVILIYVQSTVEGLNREIKLQFPGVDAFDLTNFGPVSRTGKNHQRDVSQKRAKSFLAGCHRTYRSLANIIDHFNSVYGVLMLIIVVLNQVACLAYAFGHFSVIFMELGSEEENHQQMILFGISCSWCLVRLLVICHGFGMVVKEAQATIRYIASIDASEIDHDSKLELLEFLDEVDGSRIKFMAGNIFSLDYGTWYLLLTNTVLYIVVVIQHLIS